MKNVGHVFCQIFNRDVFGWLARGNKLSGFRKPSMI